MSNIPVLSELLPQIFETANNLFHKLINFRGRDDDKKRTGIHVLVWEPGTSNLVIFPVETPPTVTNFYVVEKAVRMATLRHNSSGSSADPENKKYPGAIRVVTSLGEVIISVSGLKPEEDVFVSIKIGEAVTFLTAREIIMNLQGGVAVLPKEFSDPKHYLYHLLNT